MEKFVHTLESMKLTIIGGIALIPSLILYLTDCSVLLDPAWIAVFISGIPQLYIAITSLVRRYVITSELLVSTAMMACIYTGQIFAAGEVAFIMALGGLLEEYSADRARRGIRKLVNLSPDKARVVRTVDGKETEVTVPIEDVRPGDIIRVRPGERIAVDGIIVKGTTAVDQSVMTGESLPVDKAPGDGLYSGTMNTDGSVDMRATHAGKDSSLQKMIDLAREAEEKKAPMQRIVDKWAEWLVPIAVGIAVVTAIVYGLLTGDWVEGFHRGITILVVFCPCALVLATPVSIIAGIGQATKYGVLIKSGEALERMGKVDCLTFDKTGTLTKGRLVVSDTVVVDPQYDEDRLLLITASAESRSEHPLAKAIVKQVKQELLPVEDFMSLPGKGITAMVDGKKVVCGKSQWMEEQHIALSDDVTTKLQKLRSEGKASVLTAVDGTVVGIIALSDMVRDGAHRMVSELYEMNVGVVVLTGDNRQTADWFAKQVGVDDVRAELLPADKVAAIEDLKSEGKTVCMIGDGVNDAPAMKTADVSVAMGTMGSDVAIDSADIALMGDDIAKIPYLKRLSNATIFSIKFNITLSMVINAIAIFCSIMGWLNPVTGALVHNAGSVLVVLNAALLYDRKV